MNYQEQWNLTDIYADDSFWENDIRTIEQLTEKLVALKGTLSDAEIEPALQKVFKKLAEKGCILRS